MSGEHLIPTQIRMCFHHLEAKINLAVENYNDNVKRARFSGDELTRMFTTRQDEFKPKFEFLEDRKHRKILEIAFVQAVEKITTWRGCCCRRWPLFLPEAHAMAEAIFNDLNLELEGVDNARGLLSLDCKKALGGEEC